MSLVADYGTSSESENDSESESSENAEITKEEENKPKGKLPTPDFGNSSKSVFSNPFIEAENAKKAILEKHVKMVPSRDETKVINGKKICWNYRKGRCRFGHKCQFAHDSDLQKSAEVLEAENQVQHTVVCQRQVPKNDRLNSNVGGRNKKKRPGLSQNIVPGKKVMKIFKQQQEKEKPWTANS